MPRVIGMDVHRDFAQVVALENERLRQLGRVKLDKESLTSFAGRLAPDDEVVLEATGNTFAIVRVLRPKVGRVAVANPLQVRLIAHAKIKTDKVDAAALAQLYASGFLPEIWVPDAETEALRRQFTRRSRLVRHRTRLKNEVHAILNANLIGRCPVTDLFTATGTKWLADQAIPLADREAIDRGFREIARVGEDLALLDRALAEQAIDDPRLKRLMTITGIDMVSGLGLIGTIGDHTRFASSEKLVSYLGLNPSVRQSGSGPARHGRITKRGANHARALLVEAAWAASRVPGPLRSFFMRVMSRRGSQVAARGDCKKAGDNHLACSQSPGGLCVRPSQPRCSEAPICRASCWNAAPAGTTGHRCRLLLLGNPSSRARTPGECRARLRTGGQWLAAVRPSIRNPQARRKFDRIRPTRSAIALFSPGRPPSSLRLRRPRSAGFGT